ncbi:hypothetical protein Taro_003116 [Colocasia esculenta]|uniref:Protein FAR1-RELATED SEQUENCE n=1 Tax=Colocasia esculenta TaxID=4460 RepID=A0A843TQX9_COLES|nr:hypothetical protein [Colocasia esculenta]
MYARRGSGGGVGARGSSRARAARRVAARQGAGLTGVAGWCGRMPVGPAAAVLHAEEKKRETEREEEEERKKKGKRNRRKAFASFAHLLVEECCSLFSILCLPEIGCSADFRSMETGTGEEDAFLRDNNVDLNDDTTGLRMTLDVSALDVEANDFITSQQLQLESSDIGEPIIGMEFDTDEAAKEFYITYANRVGFGVRMNKSRRSRRDDTVIMRRFVCTREGFHSKRVIYDDGKKKRKRGTTREGCMAMIEVIKKEHGKWVTLLSQSEKEAEADFATAYMKPPLKTPSPMEKQAAEIYTGAVFDKFQEEFVESLGYYVDKVEVGVICKFSVTKEEDASKTYIVSFNETEKQANCSCSKFESSGLLCRHVLRVFFIVGIRVLPENYILKRWTKDAMSGDTLDECVIDTGLSFQEHLVAWYNDLCCNAVKYGMEGAISAEIYKVAKAALQKAFAEVAASKNMQRKGQHQNVQRIRMQKMQYKVPLPKLPHNKMPTKCGRREDANRKRKSTQDDVSIQMVTCLMLGAEGLSSVWSLAGCKKGYTCVGSEWQLMPVAAQFLRSASGTSAQPKHQLAMRIENTRERDRGVVWVESLGSEESHPPKDVFSSLF